MSGAPAAARPRDVVTSAARRASYESSGAWDGSTLVGRVRAHAAAAPDSTAVVDLGGARTRGYAQLEADACRVARHLRSLGVGPGEIVSVQLPNWYETVVVDLAVLKLGAVLNSMLPIYRAKELRHMLTAGSVRVLVTPGTYRSFDHAAMVAELRATVPTLEHHVLVGEPRADGDALGELAGDDAPLPPEPDSSAVSELIFTSGTEALPKAIVHTEDNANFSVRSCWASLGMTAADVVWMPSPIGHSTGLNFGVRMALYHGLPLVLQDRWDAAEAAGLVERFGCSYTLAATTFLSDLVEHAERAGVELPSLRLFGSGGAPVPPDLVAAAERVGIEVLRLYGSTEALVATWNRPGSPRELRLRTDGPPIDGVEVEVRSEDGEPLVGEAGEIFTRGPSTSVGLFDDPERTAATYDAGGWVRSGDLGVLDAAGCLTIVGRKKEIIIRGGLNIAPREIEDAILEHPDVADVAVVGVSDARLGERTCACVVLRPGARLVERQLTGFLADRGMATYKLPQLFHVLDALPRTSTGKVQKFKILAAIEATAPTTGDAR